MAEGNSPTRSTLDPKLQSFAVKNVKFTGVEIDRVSDDSEGKTSAMLKLVISECVLLSSLHHPNVVQFFGITTVKDSRIPILLMEKLEGCLHSKLESPVSISFVEKRSILLDVAHGLAYLHSLHPPVIHRDLTARNILLSSEGKAKIADLGVARLLNLQVGKQVKTMTNAPGNIGYMPPEALEAGCKYNASIDVFSFGHLALFTVTRVFPELLAPTYPHPKKDKVIARSEIERRKQSFDAMYQSLGDKHPLIKLVPACLQNKPSLRPSTAEIAASLEKFTIEEEAQNDRLWAMPKQELMHYVKFREKEMERMANELSTQQVLINSLEEKIELMEGEIETQNEQLEALSQQQVSQAAAAPQPSLSIDMRSSYPVYPDNDCKASTLSTSTQVGTCTPTQVPVKENSTQNSPIGAAGYLSKDTGIRFPCSFRWEKLEIPPSICKAPIEEMVTIGDSIYVRCGKKELAKFMLSSKTWTRIPKPDVGNNVCRIAELQNKLVAIEDVHVLLTWPNMVFVWNEAEGRWTTPFPPFMFVKYMFAAMSYKQYLLIVGGLSPLALRECVEILDTSKCCWYTSGTVLTLPQLNAMQFSTFSYNRVVVQIGEELVTTFQNSKRCVTVNLPKLIAHTTSTPVASKHKMTWKQLGDVPHSKMTLETVGGTLLAMGGSKKHNKVYMYNPAVQEWVAMSAVPEKSAHYFYGKTPSGDILAIDSKMKNLFVGHMDF